MKRYVCLDVEMSELTTAQKNLVPGLRNEVIQIGAVMLDESYNLISRFSSYVKPRYSSITPSINRLTGITDENIANADDFITVFDKYCYWLGDDDITTFCWSRTDYNQLWNELNMKARHRTDLFETLKTFVDLQDVFDGLIGAGVPVSLGSALHFMNLGFEGQAHAADCDAYNTARLLHKIFCTKSVSPDFDYLYNESRAEKVPAGEYNTSFAAFLSPELLARFGFTPYAEAEGKAENTAEILMVAEDQDFDGIEFKDEAEKMLIKELCRKYRVCVSKWHKLASDVMLTGEMQVA